MQIFRYLGVPPQMTMSILACHWQIAQPKPQLIGWNGFYMACTHYF